MLFLWYRSVCQQYIQSTCAMSLFLSCLQIVFVLLCNLCSVRLCCVDALKILLHLGSKKLRKIIICEIKGMEKSENASSVCYTRPVVGSRMVVYLGWPFFTWVD